MSAPLFILRRSLCTSLCTYNILMQCLCIHCLLDLLGIGVYKLPKLDHASFINSVPYGSEFINMNVQWGRSALEVVQNPIALIDSSDIFSTSKSIFLWDSFKLSMRPHTLHKVSFFLLYYKHK